MRSSAGSHAFFGVVGPVQMGPGSSNAKRAFGDSNRSGFRLGGITRGEFGGYGNPPSRRKRAVQTGLQQCRCQAQFANAAERLKAINNGLGNCRRYLTDNGKFDRDVAGDSGRRVRWSLSLEGVGNVGFNQM